MNVRDLFQWLLYLCVIVFGITNLVASSGAHMVQRLLFFVLTILVVKRISSLPLRLLVAAPFVLLTAADMNFDAKFILQFPNMTADA